MERKSESSMVEQVESLALRDVERAAATTVDPRQESPYLSADELRMLEAARSGDERALRRFYSSHQGQVRAHLYRLLGADSEIDDLVQTVFARAFNALDRFQGNSTLGTWLYRITANTTHNLLRQRFRRDRVKSALQWFNAGRESPLRSSRVEARDEAQRILQRLRPDLREVFVLYHYEGLTLHEISQILNKPVSTIGDRLTRARKKLRDLVST
jgi:RNA polymerase sigma-70 factor (ECF subfamily)